MKVIALTIVLLISQPAEAAKTCSSSEAGAAESTVDTMKDWSSVYSVFKRYAHCDDGSIAEGFDDGVVHLLASKWQSLDEAAAFAARDADFRKFFLRHIGATADIKELKVIASSSKNHCPAGLADLCDDMHSSAAIAIKESDR